MVGTWFVHIHRMAALLYTILRDRYTLEDGSEWSVLEIGKVWYLWPVDWDAQVHEMLLLSWPGTKVIWLDAAIRGVFGLKIILLLYSYSTYYLPVKRSLFLFPFSDWAKDAVRWQSKPLASVSKITYLITPISIGSLSLGVEWVLTNRVGTYLLKQAIRSGN